MSSSQSDSEARSVLYRVLGEVSVAGLAMCGLTASLREVPSSTAK
jgi:hypothetical protein